MENNNRLTKLDGVRGLLSLIVALNHSFMVVVIPVFANIWNQNILHFTNWESKIQQILMLIGNGGAAVSLFFVLSGFVLGGSLDKKWIGLKGLPNYYLKRLARLYPVYLFLVVITAIYLRYGFVYKTYPFSSAWFNWWMNFEMSFQELIQNMLFIHLYIGGVTWTLRVIVVSSILFPALYLLSRKTSKYLDFPITYLLYYLAFYVFVFSDFRDLKYVYMFYLGLTLPKWKDIFEKIKHPIIIYPALLILFYEFLSFRYQAGEYPGGVVESIISFIFIGLIVYNTRIKIFDFLNAKIFQFYGKISYSLYLVHFSVLYIESKIIFDLFPDFRFDRYYLITHIFLLVTSVIIATPISYIVFKYIEEPSGRLFGQSKKINS